MASIKTFSNLQPSAIVTPSLIIEAEISTFAPIVTLLPIALAPLIFALVDMFAFSPTINSRVPT